MPQDNTLDFGHYIFPLVLEHIYFKSYMLYAINKMALFSFCENIFIV